MDVFPLSYGGHTSVISAPIKLGARKFVMFFTSIGLNPKNSGVPVPGA